MSIKWHTATINEVANVEYGTRVVQKRDGGSIFPVYGGGGATFFMDTSNRQDRLIISRFGMSEKCTRFVDGEFFLNDSGLTLSPKPNIPITQRFLDYQCLSLNDVFYKLGKGAAQKNLDLTAFREIKIKYPPNTDLQNKVIERIDSIFLELEKATTATEKNLSNAAALFQSYLTRVFQEEGKSWNVKLLGDVCDVRDGTHDSPKYVETGIPFVTQKNIRENGLTFDNTKFISIEDHTKFYKRSNVAIGDILISMIGANRGMSALVDDDRLFSIKNVGLIKPSIDLNQIFLLYFLKSQQARNYIQQFSKGGAQEFIGLTALRKFPIPVPTISEQKASISKIESLSMSIKKIEIDYRQKLIELSKLNNAILQKAFNGELVKDWQ